MEMVVEWSEERHAFVAKFPEQFIAAGATQEEAEKNGHAELSRRLQAQIEENERNIELMRQML